MIKLNKILFALVILSVFLSGQIVQAQDQKKGEETYDITLTQTAEAPKETPGETKTLNIDDKKVLTETYKVQEGERIWQIFRARGLLKKRNLPELIMMLKKLNQSLSDLDLIHPGETILIPLEITPVSGKAPKPSKETEAVLSLDDLKDVDLEKYTVRPGDSLVRIVSKLYDVPQQEIKDDYLALLKKMNPNIKDLNRIFPNQRIKLPIFKRQNIRMPIKRADVEPVLTKDSRTRIRQMSHDLEKIFLEMGEDWIQTGQHFIPLQAGGQVNLNSDTFPILSLTNGTRVILDLYNEMPEKMIQLIPASWKNYKIIRLSAADTLKDVINKILPNCAYYKIYAPGEPLKMIGDIGLTVSADWIIQMEIETVNTPVKICAITLLDNPAQGTPPSVKKYLGSLGIKIIDFPVMSADTLPAAPEPAPVMTAQNSPIETIETLLQMLGYGYSKDLEIPVYENQQSGYNLMIKADFSVQVGEKNYIIDLTGLEPQVLPLLKEQHFTILSMKDENDPVAMVKKTLEFFNIPVEPEPKSFLAADREASRNIKIDLPGIVFADATRQSVLATKFKLPDELSRFLSQKGVKIFLLNPL